MVTDDGYRRWLQTIVHMTMIPNFSHTHDNDGIRHREHHIDDFQMTQVASQQASSPMSCKPGGLWLAERVAVYLVGTAGYHHCLNWSSGLVQTSPPRIQTLRRLHAT